MAVIFSLFFLCSKIQEPSTGPPNANEVRQHSIKLVNCGPSLIHREMEILDILMEPHQTVWQQRLVLLTLQNVLGNCYRALHP